MTFDLDSCEMTIEKNSASQFEVYVDTQNDPLVIVTVNPDAKYVSIINNKPLWQKYTNYFCRVVWFVPDNTQLPNTIINANGRRISTLVGTSINWTNRSLKLNTEFPLGAIFRIYLDDASIGDLEVTALSGDLDLQRLTIGNAHINTTDFNIYLNIQHSVIIRANDTYRSCLNSFNPICDLSNDNSTCDYILYANNNNNDTITSVVNVDCSGDCFIHAIVAQRDDMRESLGKYSVGNTTIAFNSASTNRIKQAFQTIPVPDMVLMGIRGPGAPKNGRWIWSNRMLYLDVFSFYLLSPTTSSVNISMTPSFCPGTNLDIELDAMVAINNLLKQTVNTTANPDNIYAFQQYDNVFGYPSKNFVVGVDTVSGENYLYSPSFSTVSRLLTILVTNLILTAVAGIFYFYVFVKRLLDWRRDTIELWGDLFYGKTWPEHRDAIFQRAGMFYMLEFVVGFPKQKTEYWRMLLTSFIHLLALAVLAAPSLTAVLIYVNSSQMYVNSVPAAAGVAYAILLAYAVYSVVYLFLYYFNSNVHYFKWISVPFYIFVIIISFLSFVYIVNTAFWIILGALIKPTKILPYASVVIVIVLHAIGTYTRVQALLDELKEEVDSVPAESPPQTTDITTVAQVPTIQTPIKPAQPPDITGSLTVQSSIQLFKKTRILELRDATIREQIVQEIVVFVILLLFFIFILVGFTTIGSNQDVASGISSLMVFLVGGGVNIPLAVGDTPDAKRKRWEKQIVKENQNKKDQ